VLINLGRPKEGYPLVAHSAQTYQRVLGLNDSKTLAAMHNLGSAENAVGNTAAAEALYRQVSEVRQRVIGPDHPWTLLTMNNLATSLMQQRRFAEAEPILRELLVRADRVNGPDHEATIDVLNALGSAVQLQGKKSEAEQLFREMLLRSRRAFPSTHENVVKSVATLALALEKDGKVDEALEYYREAYALLPTSDVAPRQAAQYTRSYALLLFNTGKLQESEVPLRDAIKRMKTANIAKSVGYRETLLALAKVCEESGKSEEAKALRDEAAAMKPTSQPATKPTN
jgi:tetratricopeptide (TPR) repeat protein